MATFPVSSFAEGHIVDKEYCCSICEELNKETNAVFYCKKCNTFFCGQCIHSHSKHFLWFNKPYGTEKIMEWPLSKKMENYLITCDIHKDEKLTKVCQDHSWLCCSKCVDLDHRRCTQVTALSKVKRQSSDVKNWSFRVPNTLSRLKKLQRYRDDNKRSMQGPYAQLERNMVDTMRLNIQSFLVQCGDTSRNDTYEHVEYTVETIRQKINVLLAAFENSSIKEKKKEMTLNQTPLVSVINTCISHQGELLRLSDAMRKVKDQPKLLLMARYKCQDKIQQSEIYMNENFSDEVFSVQGMSKHKVKIFSDSKTCWITGVCVLPNGQVLVADRGDTTVKLLNQHYSVVSHCGVTAWPWDMCQITPSEVAVTVDDIHNKHEVQFITVKESTLVPGRKLQLQHNCGGIAYHQGDLYICTGSALYKYSLRGKQVCRLYEDVSDTLTVRMCAVSPSGDRLYITNYSQHKLLTLARDGTVLATFTDPELRCPCGLHVTPAGLVLVCGWGSYTVLQMDWEGCRKLATLATREREGVRTPYSVYYSSTTSSIIVGQSGDNILVFKVE